MLINQEDWIKVGKGAAIAGLGAGSVYALQTIPTLPSFGVWGPVVGALCSVLINIIRKKLGIN